MSSAKLQELALRKEILSLRAEMHRLEIEQQLGLLRRHPLRGLVSGLNVARLAGAHPLLLSSAGALVSRLGVRRVVKLGVVAAAAWYAARFFRALRTSGNSKP